MYRIGLNVNKEKQMDEKELKQYLSALKALQGLIEEHGNKVQVIEI